MFLGTVRVTLLLFCGDIRLLKLVALMEVLVGELMQILIWGRLVSLRIFCLIFLVRVWVLKILLSFVSDSGRRQRLVVVKQKFLLGFVFFYLLSRVVLLVGFLFFSREQTQGRRVDCRGDQKRNLRNVKGSEAIRRVRQIGVKRQEQSSWRQYQSFVRWRVSQVVGMKGVRSRFISQQYGKMRVQDTACRADRQLLGKGVVYKIIVVYWVSWSVLLYGVRGSAGIFLGGVGE